MGGGILTPSRKKNTNFIQDQNFAVYIYVNYTPHTHCFHIESHQQPAACLYIKLFLFFFENSTLFYFFWFD